MHRMAYMQEINTKNDVNNIAKNTFWYRGWSGRAVKLTVPLQFVLRFKMCGAMLPHPIRFHDMVHVGTNLPASFWLLIVFKLTAYECKYFQDGVLQSVYDIKIYRGNGGKVHSFLTSALSEVEWSASLRFCFTLFERATDTRWMGGLVVLRDSIFRRRENILPVPRKETRSSSL